MGYMDQPSPSDEARFLALVTEGVDPYYAAREISGGRLTASRFRSLAKRDPAFAGRYEAAKAERTRSLKAAAAERHQSKGKPSEQVTS
jgi:hypothetical protein